MMMQKVSKEVRGRKSGGRRNEGGDGRRGQRRKKWEGKEEKGGRK